MRRFHINVPPNPINVILKKARNSSAWLGIGAAEEGGAAGSDMAEISSLRPPLRPIDLLHRRQFNHHEFARPPAMPELRAQGPMPGSISFALVISRSAASPS